VIALQLAVDQVEEAAELWMAWIGGQELREAANADQYISHSYDVRSFNSNASVTRTLPTKPGGGGGSATLGMGTRVLTDAFDEALVLDGRDSC